jgi:ubiquinone/menaquinone biosynthesis C-methylase UbiE
MFVEPNEAVNSFELEPGMTVADFGSGSGFYAAAMARKVGEKGKVYAFDIQRASLDIVRSKAKLFHLLNVEALRADLDKAGSTQLKEETVDFVLISNALFQSHDKKSFIAEAKRILKTKGRVAVIEWEKLPSKFGPPLQERISQEEALRLFEEAGFSRRKEFYAGEYHYGLLFEKQ